MGRHKRLWRSFRQSLIEIFLERTGRSSLSLGAQFDAWLEGLNESERARLLSALDSACGVLGEHLARLASEEMGIEFEATVHRVGWRGGRARHSGVARRGNRMTAAPEWKGGGKDHST